MNRLAKNQSNHKYILVVVVLPTSTLLPHNSIAIIELIIPIRGIFLFFDKKILMNQSKREKMIKNDINSRNISIGYIALRSGRVS